MKRVRIVLVILVCIALGVSFLTYRLGMVLHGLTKELDRVEAAIGQPGELESACQSIEDYWMSHTKKLTRYLSQRYVDDLTAAVLLLKPMSRAQDTALFESEIRMLRLQIEELWEAHSPSLSSLF